MAVSTKTSCMGAEAMAKQLSRCRTSITHAGVVELVDAPDSKSGVLRTCRFESDHPHQPLRNTYSNHA